MAIYCGIIIGGFSGYVADDPQLGWRLAFDVTGLAGILYALPLLLFLRDAPRAAANSSADAETSFGARGPGAAQQRLVHPARRCTSRCPRWPAGW